MNKSPAAKRQLNSKIDPVSFEVIRNALLNITEEMAVTIRRAAYSTNIKTRADFSCAFFDASARCVAQSFAQPAHLVSMASIVPVSIREIGAENMKPGDSYVVNDAHRGTSHLNDITVISPVDVDGYRVGYLANMAHHVDVGGSAPASLGVSREIFQEGIILPPTRVACRRQDRCQCAEPDPCQHPGAARNQRRPARPDVGQCRRSPPARRPVQPLLRRDAGGILRRTDKLYRALD